MKDTAPLLRRTVAACLVICAAITVASIALMPEFAGDHTDRLAAIAADGTTAGASAALFALAQLPFAVGLLGVAHLLRSRTPVLAILAGTLCALGGFGHAVYGGQSLVMLEMARDPQHYDAYARVLGGVESGWGIPFMAMGLLGTVLGIVLTAVALWRAGLGPRWLPPLLAAFVVVEFGLAGLSVWASYGASLLYAAGLLAMGQLVSRSPLARWGGVETPAPVLPARA